MRILVTGGAGFIRSNLIRYLLAQRQADTVVNLDLLTYAGSRERLRDLEHTVQYQFVQGDICEPDIVRQAMRGCQTVIHFAAETHVDRSITNATHFLRTNVEGTYVLLREAQACNVSRFVHISTDEVYGPVLEGTVDEQAPLSPRSPYAASKAAADLLAQAFQATYKLPTIVVRPTNIYGPAQLPEKFIPLCITNGYDRLPVPVYGDGQQRRAWLFVKDLCDALQVVIERGEAGVLYNMAGGHEQTNLDTARAILSHLGLSETFLQFVTDRPGHDRRYAMDDAKLRQLGWRPTMPFKQGLSETVAWYREHAEWWRPLAQALREDSYHWLNRPSRPSAQQPSSAVL